MYHSENILARVVSFIGGLIVVLLGLRFILAFLGANGDNSIVSFIYTKSNPFAAPFFGLFHYKPQFGISRFEFETLVAMLAYALLTWIVVALVSRRTRGA